MKQDREEDQCPLPMSKYTLDYGILLVYQQFHTFKSGHRTAERCLQFLSAGVAPSTIGLFYDQLADPPDPPTNRRKI